MPFWRQKFMYFDDVTVGYVQNNRPEQPSGGQKNTFAIFLNLSHLE